MTRIALAFATLSAAGTPAAADPVVPTAVTLPAEAIPLADAVAALNKQTNFDLALDGLDGTIAVGPFAVKATFWEAVETLAAQAKARVRADDGGKGPGQKGRRLVLVPAGSPTPACAAGAFRVAFKSVSARRSVEADATTYDLGLAVMWEPRFPVLRIDAHPRDLAGTDDAGRKLAIAGRSADRGLTAGFAESSAFQLAGLVRHSQKIATLSGRFVATAADEWVTPGFAAIPAKLPAASAAVKGIAVTLTRYQASGPDWLVGVTANYPAGGPKWESFEYGWLRSNELRLVPPAGGTAVVAEFLENDDATVVYVVKGGVKKGLGGKGWGLEYRTPGPLREVEVPFTLKGVDLP